MAVQALLTPQPGPAGYLHRELLIHTPEGRRVDLLTVTDCHGVLVGAGRGGLALCFVDKQQRVPRYQAVSKARGGGGGDGAPLLHRAVRVAGHVLSLAALSRLLFHFS